VRLPLPGVTIKLSDSPGAISRRPPRVGEHTREVLAEWLGRPLTDAPATRADTDAEASA
jgi:crotonobetainyl-CoA:carnitine CoA-transferase CaiB-like acyl-CoA transferase